MMSTMLWSDRLVGLDETFEMNLSLLIINKSRMLFFRVGIRIYWLSRWSDMNLRRDLADACSSDVPPGINELDSQSILGKLKSPERHNSYESSFILLIM